VTNNVKLIISFAVGAAFLLVVAATAVTFINHVDSILSDVGLYNLQINQVADAANAIRVHPDRQRANLARLDDLEKWSRADFEHAQIASARRQLERGAPARALDELEKLSEHYRKASGEANDRLQTLHFRAIHGAIILMSAGVVLLATVMVLVRRWFLGPVFDVYEAIHLTVSNHPRQPLPKSEMGELLAPMRELMTQIKQLEDRAALAERFATAGEVSARISQNLRNLIHSVRTLATRERNASDVAPSAKAGFDSIIFTTKTMDHWAGSLVNATRPLELRACPQSIEPVIRNAVSLLNPLLAERAIRVEFNPTDSLADVHLDRDLFEQALVAIMQNAIDASPDESRIIIRTANGPNKMVVVTVQDEGEGMSEEVRRRAFDPHFTKRKDGVGLGLTYAQKIVELHGGKIDLASQPQKGTRVHIYLPAAPQEKL
jgi:signal transduction histidine kinase